MSKKKILMVDDEEDLVRMYKLNLEATKKYEVRTDNKGIGAYQVAKAFQPDLIFFDIIMPGVDIAEVVRQIREDQGMAHIPIVFLTATVTAGELKQHGGVVGGESFLPKPVTTAQIVECIKKHLGE